MPNITRDDAVKPRLVRPRRHVSGDGRSCSLFTMCKITSGAQGAALANSLTDKLADLWRSQTVWPRRVERQGHRIGGARRDRTDDLMLAKHALSQLSYGPDGLRPVGAIASWFCWVASSAGGDVRHLGCRGISRDGHSALRTFGPGRHTSRLPEGEAFASRRGAGAVAPDPKTKWWAWDDSNVRPHPYQGCALTT